MGILSIAMMKMSTWKNKRRPRRRKGKRKVVEPEVVSSIKEQVVHNVQRIKKGPIVGDARSRESSASDEEDDLEVLFVKIQSARLALHSMNSELHKLKGDKQRVPETATVVDGLRHKLKVINIIIISIKVEPLSSRREKPGMRTFPMM